MTFCFLSCWRQKLPGCPPRASWGGTAPSVTQLRNRTAMPEPARRSACRKTRRPHSRGRCARQRPRASLTMSDRADEEGRTAFPRRSLPFSSAPASLWAGLGAPGAVPSPGRPGLRVALPSCSLQWPGLSRIPRCGGSGPASHARAKPAAGSLCASPPPGPATVLTVGGAQTDGGRSSDRRWAELRRASPSPRRFVRRRVPESKTVSRSQSSTNSEPVGGRAGPRFCTSLFPK